MNRKKKKVVGAIAIEAVLSLTIFMLAILALMMGSLLMRAQSSMQYALNQTAKEISGYFYLLDKFGIASMLSENTTENADADLNQLNTTIGHIFAFSGDLKGDAKTIKKQITETNEKFQSGSLTKEDLEELKAIPANEKGKIEASIDEIKDDIELLKSSDKKVLFKAVIQVFSRACINTAASKYLTPFVCKALMPKYLTDGDVDTYYNSIGVIPTSINFDGSHILGDGRTISLVVEYQIDASKLTLGFYKKNLTFRQVAVTSAWIQKNESGSLQDLKTVGKYFNEGYVKEHAEELKLLKEKNDAEAAEAEKKAKEEAEAVSKALTKTTTTTTDTKKTDDSEDSDTTTTTTTTEAVLSEDIKAFIDKYPEGQKLYDTYGPDVVRAVNKCSDPRAAIALILAAEKGDPAYGEDAVKALNKSGDKAVAALKKVPSQKCAQVVAANGDRAADIIAANGPDAVTAIGDNDSPKDAIKAIERATDKKTVIQALNLAPTKECAVAIMRCDGAAKVICDFSDNGKDKAQAAEAVAAITKGLDCGNGQGVVDALNKRKGDARDVLDALNKVDTPTKECTDALITAWPDAGFVFIEYGQEAVIALGKKNSKDSTKSAIRLIVDYNEYGLAAINNGFSAVESRNIMQDYGIPGGNLLKNGVTPDLIKTLAAQGLTPDYFENPKNPHSNRHCNNKKEAETLIEQYNEIHSKFSDDEIKNLKERTMAQYKIWKDNYKSKDPAVQAEGKTNKQIGPAVAGVYWKGHEDLFFDSNALRPMKDGQEDKKQKAKPPEDCVEELDEIIKRMPDNVKASYDESKGEGSHAEIYAVNAALKAGAKADDILVYVNNASSEYSPMVTCPHCEWILNELGVKVISNVEI